MRGARPRCAAEPRGVGRRLLSAHKPALRAAGGARTAGCPGCPCSARAPRRCPCRSGCACGTSTTRAARPRARPCARAAARADDDAAAAGAGAAGTLVDDATLASVRDGTQALVLAAHVLQHEAHVLAAVRAWLRVVRAGGLVLLILPDMCERDASGDKFRLATRPSTSSTSCGGRSAPTRTATSTCAGASRSGARAAGRATGGRGSPTSFLPLDNSTLLAHLELFHQKLRESPVSAHLHAWTPATARAMLELAQRRRPAGQFDIVDLDLHAADDAPRAHDELRIALRKSSTHGLRGAHEEPRRGDRPADTRALDVPFGNGDSTAREPSSGGKYKPARRRLQNKTKKDAEKTDRQHFHLHKIRDFLR